MKNPIEVVVNRQSNSAVISYSQNEVIETLDIWGEGTVAADVDADGAIIDIEVLDLAPEVLARARAYAEERDLAFPPFAVFAEP